MGRRIALVAVTVLCTLGLGVSAWASYAGIGLVQTGGSSARVGSIWGPGVTGGGPNSGK